MIERSTVDAKETTAATLGEKAADANTTVIDAVVIDETANVCGEQSIALRGTETGYQVNWTAVNAGTKAWEGYKLVKADSNPLVSLASNTIDVPTTAPGETAALTFDVNIDSSTVSSEPLWVEFYIDSGTEGFCEFYFEAPAK